MMARYPREGQVKSRLAATIGVAGAARVYRAFLADLVARLGGDPRWSFHWAYDPPDSPFADEIAAGAPAFAQVDGDLGRRMAGALGHLLDAGHRRVVLIGSDVPHLPVEAVAAAFAALDEGADLVLGPVEDGGYCLIGSPRVPPVFRSVAWGGPDVLSMTLGHAERAGLVTHLLAPTYDVDDAGGLRRLASEIAAGTVRDLAATRNALEQAGALGYS